MTKRPERKEVHKRFKNSLAITSQVFGYNQCYEEFEEYLPSEEEIVQFLRPLTLDLWIPQEGKNIKGNLSFGGAVDLAKALHKRIRE